MSPLPRAYVVGTFDTKGEELEYVRARIAAMGVGTCTVDLSTTAHPAPADGSPCAAVDVSAHEVAEHHPGGARAVLGGDDRGRAIGAMALAFERFVASREDVAGMIALGGSGGTALAAPGMRALPIGVPKVLVSTVASGNVAPYVGASDLVLLPAVTDIAGLNRISARVLANAAHALAGMVRGTGLPAPSAERAAVGMTMFGVTTPCVQRARAALESRFDCLVFHATGTGGRTLEKLVDSRLVQGVLDVTLTEVADLFAGGIMSAGEERLDAIARTRVPWVGSVGALDMVNFAARETVPARYAGRNLYVHNPQITLMRTTAEENAAMGEWIAAKLNRCAGPVCLVLPEKGVSALDAPGKPFYDPAADSALFAALEAHFVPSSTRRLERLALHINDDAFADALVARFLELL